jgi:hypothetical protein
MKVAALYIYGFLALSIASAAHADEMSTLQRLSDIVETQCRRFYGIDTQSAIEDLQQKKMSEVDKLACAYPFAFHKMQNRLQILEQLDPQSAWGKDAYVTLAARIYRFNLSSDAPRPGGPSTEIPAVQPDLLILHRILRQTTPYALAFAYPRLTGRDANLPADARVAAAGASELTPWSATLRIARGNDCYGPKKDECLNNRMAAMQKLLQAIQLFAKNQNFYGYVTEYANTPEATELQSVPYIRIANEIRKSISGDPVDYIMGVRVHADSWSVRPDLRDVLDYLAASDKDLKSPANTTIILKTRDCKIVYASLFALANEEKDNSVRQALSSMNPMEAVVAADPKLYDDGAKTQAMLNKQDCNQLQALSSELNMHGVLSRFQAYQTHLILLNSYDYGLSNGGLKEGSRRYALISDVQQTIQEVQEKAKAAGLKLKASSSPVPQQLVDYISQILKKDNM